MSFYNLDGNCITSKLDGLVVLANVMFDILVITETKLDSKFPMLQFHINEFSTRFSRELKWGLV